MKAQNIKHLITQSRWKKPLISYRDFTFLVDPDAKLNNEKCNDVSITFFDVITFRVATAPFVS